MTRIGLLFWLSVAVIVNCCFAYSAAGQASGRLTQTVIVFDSNMIHFAPEDSTRYDTDTVKSSDRGRVINRTVTLPHFATPVRVAGHLIIRPTPKDELEMYDRWDRAGNVRLAVEGGPDLELIKFMTAYGGRTEYDVDLSPLAALLQGECNIRAFIDTWVTPAWTIDFSLTYASDSTANNADWVTSVLFEESYTRESPGDLGKEVPVEVPAELRRVVLRYYVSGHCTDGTGADEFERKDNVISVDGVVVYRFQPWRDDCRQFRAINPYCRRWTDGSWSCDYSRSGWCPGDLVKPVELDLTDHLTPGRHTIHLVVENVRPTDDKGNFGYWRNSIQLLGYK